MNISKLEADFLFKHKVQEGKSYDEAEFEIERDKHFIKDTKDIKKQVAHLMTQLTNAYQEIDRLKIINKQLRKEKFVNTLKNYESNDTKASVTHLTRIMIILEEGRIGFTDLSRACMIDKDKCKSAIGFLSRFGLIEIVPEGKITFIKLRREVE